MAAGEVNREVQKAQLMVNYHPQTGQELNVSRCQTRNPHLSLESKIPNALHSLNQVIMIVGLMAPA